MAEKIAGPSKKEEISKPKNLNIYFCKRGKEPWEGGVLVSSEDIEQALRECTEQWTKENWPERAKELVEEFPPKKLDITKPGVLYNDELR